MSTRDIKTFHEPINCDVCGRTLLRGERAETWLAGGQRREVCDLCSARARHEGWIREDTRLEMTQRSPIERRSSLLGRFRGRRAGQSRPSGPARTSEPAAPVRGEEDPHEEWEDGEELEAEAPAPAAAPPAGASPSPPREAPPAPPEGRDGTGPREPRDVHAVPTAPEHRVAAALEVFNGSEHVKTVAGVARSLGEPEVAARSLEGTSRVSVAVSWELCWYRYEVELAHAAGSVTKVGQGYELSELEPEDRLGNAGADEYGRLHPAGS